MKMAANFSIACAIESMAEASALVKSYGIAVPDFTVDSYSLPFTRLQGLRRSDRRTAILACGVQVV